MVSSASLCAWMVLLAPLIAAPGILLFGLHRKGVSAGLAVGGLLVSLVCASWLFAQALTGRLPLPLEVSVDWMLLPDLAVPFGLLIDRLSILMALVVTGVGSAIFLYSIGYMADDAGSSRYFGLLSLFAFSMLAIVLANNWILLFVGWELVGFCSYALIGHWYERPAAAEAGKKAFMVNRVADFGFLVGILALWAATSPVVGERTFNYTVMQERLASLLQTRELPVEALSVIGLLIFCGVLGKSAQMPLHVWLPDAMEGPTSVSALIHAATMVAAGVYLLCRTFWLFAELHTTLAVIAWVGGATAFFSAWLAVVETDLKRILAYSTLSQLGYMVMALGLGGAAAGMYHLTTHAFFKALLFLAAGSVIHGTRQQDIRELGGLWRSMRLTSSAFLIGGLALAGFPGLSGFFSKDEILVLAHEHNPALFWVALFTAGLTAFYIARAWCVAFIGKPAAQGHPHARPGSQPEWRAGESPAIMLAPLALLSALSIAGGYLGIPVFLGEHRPFDFAQGGVLSSVEGHRGQFRWDIAWMSLVAVAAGLGLAWAIYVRRLISSEAIKARFAWLHRLLVRRYYLDDLYAWYVDRIQQRILAGACALFERLIIIGLAVNGVAWVTKTSGGLIRYCQTGRVQTYVLALFGGIVAFLYLAGRF